MYVATKLKLKIHALKQMSISAGKWLFAIVEDSTFVDTHTVLKDAKNFNGKSATISL